MSTEVNFPSHEWRNTEYLTGYMQTVIDEQEATVKAAITGDRN